VSTRRRASLWTRTLRASDILFDSIGMRPLGVAVFAASVALLIHLIGVSHDAIRADAVAVATQVDHPSQVASFVTTVYVKPGDHVEIGAPLAELSSYFIDQRIERTDSEIEQLINQAKLAQAQLLVDEERWVAPSLRSRPTQPSLAAPTDAYYSKQIEVLRLQRRALEADREALIVKSNSAGVVAQVTWPGASIAEGASVASVMPEYAEEIVAYVPAATDPRLIATDASAYIVGTNTVECQAPGFVRRRGAAVVEAPAQLTRFFRPVHGTPVHIAVPPACRLGIGQVLVVDFENGSGNGNGS
jgi:multidrug efflux pump subunit AcrA (membrane-fusion protein)